MPDNIRDRWLSSEPRLEKDNNFIHYQLIDCGWKYHGGSYSLWIEGGCIYAPDQRYAAGLQVALDKLEAGEPVEIELPWTLPSEVVQ
jgi:hypothetical protein